MSFLDKKIPGFAQTYRGFLSSKTNWTGMSMIATGVTAYIIGDSNLTVMMGAIFGGLAFISVKDAQSKP